MQDATICSVMTVDETSTNLENNYFNEENNEYPESRQQHCEHHENVILCSFIAKDLKGEKEENSVQQCTLTDMMMRKKIQRLNCFDVFEVGLGQNAEQEVNHLGIETDNIIPKTKYYRLDRVVFAEPIETVQTNGAESNDSGTQEDAGEITFVDNVIVKKRAGKRNKYFIDIKDDCLDCPVSNCSQTFATKTLLKAHVRKVHCATTKYMCEECGAGFTAAYLLKRHSAVHSSSKVQCAVCGKWLSQRTDLSVHMKTHGAARRHACATCGKMFLRLSSLRRHETFVHRDGQLVCKVCSARFTSRKLWSRHRATHATQPCGICGITARNAKHKH